MESASISIALYPLAALACPIGMGLMMWMMARGKKREEGREPEPSQPASVEVLREKHRRLAEQIDRLEREQASQSDPLE